MSELNTEVADARMRPHLSAILFCTAANTTGDNKGNLLGVFDTIATSTIPSLAPCVLYIKTANTVGANIEVVAIRPGKDRETVLSYPVALTGSPDFTQPVYVMNMVEMGIPVETEGVYWFEVWFKGECLGRASLKITKMEDADNEQV